MFDDGIIYLIEDSDIDRLRNIFILTYNLYQFFDNFEIFFEFTTQPLYIYRINSTRSDIMRNSNFFKFRILFLIIIRTID
jgi:hypothetical protein